MNGVMNSSEIMKDFISIIQQLQQRIDSRECKCE